MVPEGNTHPLQNFEFFKPDHTKVYLFIIVTTIIIIIIIDSELTHILLH